MRQCGTVWDAVGAEYTHKTLVCDCWKVLNTQKHGSLLAMALDAQKQNERAENQITTREYVTYLQDNRGSSCGLGGPLALLAL